MKKPFFQTWTIREISKLESRTIKTPEGLVDKIQELEKGKALILDFDLSHPEFSDTSNRQYNSRRTMRGVKISGSKKSYPSYIKLKQPRSQGNAFNFLQKGIIPLNIRNQAFYEEMHEIPEEDNFYVGYMFWPVAGNETSPILVPFWSICQGAMIDSYSQKLKSTFKNSQDSFGSFVEREYSPNIILRVPSQERNHPRYVQRWRNIPTKHNAQEEIATNTWNSRPDYGRVSGFQFIDDISKAPEHMLTNVGIAMGRSYQHTMIYPQCVAGHHEIKRHFVKKGDLTPFKSSQFALLSKQDAEVWGKIRNNILIIENGELVQPRLDQQSMLFGRYVGKTIKKLQDGEVQDTMYWDPKRDGRVSDYFWK